jgi:ribosomal protein S18 acetylase RimI-like enzyme
MDFTSVDQDNLAECAALFVKVFNNPPWNENWEVESVALRLDDCYRTPGFIGVAVRAESEIVGFAVGYIERWDKGQHFYLKEMCVATEQQNGGVGTALLLALEERLKAKGAEKLYLLTARDTSAQAFYEKRGFYVSPRMVMMSKWLSPK